jgi:hypothetical protein
MPDLLFDGAENFHPFECDGKGKCRHCDRRKTEDHDPATCALCTPQEDPEAARYEPTRNAPPTKVRRSLIRFLVIDKRDGRTYATRAGDWRAAMEMAFVAGFMARADLKHVGTFRLDD